MTAIAASSESWTIWLVATLVLLWMTSQIHKFYSRRRKLRKDFAGPPSFPMIGNLWELREPTEMLNTFSRWQRKYGPRMIVDLGMTYPCVFTCVPADVQRILTAVELGDKSAMYKVMRGWLGDGLIVSSGEKWHSHRKLLSPAFHFSILEKFQQVFNDKAQELVRFLQEKVDDGEQVVDVSSLFSKYTLDIICETAMGKKLNCVRNPENKILDATVRESELIWKRWKSPWLAPDWVWALSSAGREERRNLKILEDFNNEVIREKELLLRDEHEDGNNDNGKESAYWNRKKGFAFLDLLLHQKAMDPAFTEEDVQNEVKTFMFAGHDTTGLALTWTVYLLGLYPEHQDLVCREVDAVFGDEHDITASHLSKLKYLEMCIKESLRIYPIVPMFSRNVPQDFELEKGVTVPKGMVVMVYTYGMCHNSEIFPEPAEFRPERFSYENTSKRHPYAYIPFSAGQRNCIGQKFAMAEMKTTLASLFRRFSVKSLDARVNVKVAPEIVLRPQGKIRIEFKPR